MYVPSLQSWCMALLSRCAVFTEFQVLLVSSAFMSPMDSHGNTNRNAVRMFGPDKLSKPASEEKWDRVKVVCFQPYNKV